MHSSDIGSKLFNPLQIKPFDIYPINPYHANCYKADDSLVKICRLQGESRSRRKTFTIQI